MPEEPGGSVLALRPPDQPGTAVLALHGSIRRADVTTLPERACVLLEGTDAVEIVCDVAAVDQVDAALVDALARLQVEARRHGRLLRICHAPLELLELVDLMGLSAYLFFTVD